jgi:hypothetical protein
MEIHVKLTIDDRLVAAARWLERRLSARRLGLLALLGTLGAGVVLADPVSRPHTFEAGQRISAAEINDNFDVLYDELNAREIANDLTIAVDDCQDLRAELAELDFKLIASTATVTLELPEGAFDCDGTIVIDHRDGEHIHIVGQGSGSTSLAFHSVDGFAIPPGRQIGLIDKLTAKGAALRGNGVTVSPTAYARLGGDLVLREFVDGVHAFGGFVDAAGVTCDDNLNAGFQANVNGGINAVDARASTNAGYGFQALTGSVILADGAIADSNEVYGFEANVGSAILAGPDTVATNSTHGFNANDHSVISVDQATSTDNEVFGFVGWNNSTVNVRSSTTSGNLLDYGAGFGAFTHVRTPMGTGQIYREPGPNVVNTTEQSFVFTD